VPFDGQYLDQLLLNALRADDEKALNHLFEANYNRLFRTGLKAGADTELIKESIQAVFKDLWVYRHSLGEVQSFEAYLKASVKKRLAREMAKSDSANRDNLESVQLSVQSYEAILIEQEEDQTRKALLVRALAELPPRQKEIISLKYFEELSYKEIADKTGLQVDSIYKSLHEGIKKLKSLLATA
jgi:RNA polymerase sigma factor (sigma-70 family)